MLRKISWTALRQVESIRESVAFTLKGGAVDRGTGKPDGDFAEWLKAEGVDPIFFRDANEGTLHLSVLETIEQAVAGHGVNMLRMHRAGSYSRFDEPDVGPDRSSSGWERLPNFITSSALVRLLGAMEQYELDVLKALLYYRPEGKHYQPNEAAIDADMRVVTELPDAKGHYSMPALWSWMKKPAENAVERRKIYKSVFGIDCYPSAFCKLKPSEIHAYYQNVYEQRNAIAHGRALVEVTLADYCKAEAFALTMFEHLSSESIRKYSLGV